MGTGPLLFQKRQGIESYPLSNQVNVTSNARRRFLRHSFFIHHLVRNVDLVGNENLQITVIRATEDKHIYAACRPASKIYRDSEKILEFISSIPN